MAERRLRFSERARVAETGNLGDLSPDPSQPLRNAIVSLVERAWSDMGYDLRSEFSRRVQHECAEYFGWGNLSYEKFPTSPNTSASKLNDYLEILVEEGQTTHQVRTTQGFIQTHQPWPDIVDDLNRVFDRHRYAHRFEGQTIHAISSPTLDRELTGPALLAVHRPGWEQVQRSYREALHHQRGGAEENDDALTAANAALEAALRAVGLEGKTLGDLGKSLQKSRMVPAHLAGTPKMVNDLLQRSNAIRSQDGDAHGKAPGAVAVPQSLVNLAVHLAGAFIVYLAEVAAETLGT